MRPGRFFVSAVILAAGGFVAAALVWALLNVPESSAAALALSAFLALLVLMTIGVTCGIVIAWSAGRSLSESARHALSALPAFAVGAALFAALWLITQAIDSWWAAHRGEIDAVFLRYLGTTRTAPLHVARAWLTWLARWALGLLLVVAAIAAGVDGGLASLGRRLRRALSPAALLVAAVAVSLISQGLWRLAYWRPAGLPPTWVEPAFAAVKLGVLYVLAIAIVTTALTLLARGMRSG